MFKCHPHEAISVIGINLSSILKQGYLVSLDCLVFDCGLFREK